VKRSFRVESRSAASPDVVFGLLADATTWATWAGPFVPSSRWQPDAPSGGLGAVRLLGLGPLSSREEIVAYDAPRHLAYVLRTGESVHHYRAEVELTARPGGGTHIVWSGSVESAVPGMALVVAGGFRRLVQGFAIRLARYAETVAPTQ
jgi:uncharacterized protein YndB with AHSA1/START domain